MATTPGRHGFRWTGRRALRLLALGLAAVAVAGCGNQELHAQRIDAGATEASDVVSTTAATITAQELGYLAALRPSSDRLAQVAGRPTVDSVLVAFGYGVCRRKAQRGETWMQIELDVANLGGGPASEAARMGVLIVQAARANLCG